jgi:predicted metallopeptidase
MPIKYHQADDIKKEAEEIVRILNWSHIDFSNLGFLRSTGSTSPRTIARCHALGKAMQMAMGKTTGFYLIEVISEKFDKLPESEKTKTIIHELMHIPKTFGGGFIHHDKVHERNVRIVFEQYQNLKRKTVFNMLNKPVEIEEQKSNLIFKESFQEKEKKFRWF